MELLSQSVYAVMLLLGGALIFVITRNLLDGGINTVGLLRTTTDGPIEPERLLMLIATIGTAFTVVSYSLAQGKLPDIPAEGVTALGGGNLFYLIGKRFRN